MPLAEGACLEGASPAAPTHPRAGDGLLKVRFPPIPPLKPTWEGRRDSGCQKRRRNPGSSGRRIALPTVDWACSDPSLGAHRPPGAHWSPELDGGCSHEVSHTERMCSVSLVPSCTAVGEIGTSQAEATGSRFGLSIRNVFSWILPEKGQARWQAGGQSSETCVP